MDENLQNLTWDDLRQWAGAKVLGRGKTYIKNVRDLARTENGGLAAWVSGSDDYATRVEAGRDGELESLCTCPYQWGPCKHAVAVILAGLEQIKAGRVIPPIDRAGELYRTLVDQVDAEDDDDDWEEDDDDGKTGAGTSVAAQSHAQDRHIAAILGTKSKDELISLVLALAARHPEVERKIIEDEQLHSGRIDKLVAALRREIRTVTREEAWYNPWNDEGHRPDYSHIQEQLAALLGQGQADLVMDLGRELWQEGKTQVEQADDEGDSAEQIGACMEIVFRAAMASSLSRPAQVLWMIDTLLEDQYSICDACEQFARSPIYGQGDWGEVAARLEERLIAMTKRRSGDLSGRYDLTMIIEWLSEALKNSGQTEKVVPLLEREVDATLGYERLVDTLLQAGNHELARQWCIEGYQKTATTAAGIAAGLQRRLRELAVREKKRDLVAAYRADDFFTYPSIATFSELRQAAEQIGCWPAVRAAALAFLESGHRPDRASGKGDRPPWPLPAPEVVAGPSGRSPRDYPDLSTLIDIALLEQRLDDVVSLYQAQRQTRRPGVGKGREVAAAVAATHPDVTLAIWQELVITRIKLVKPSAYEEAAVYLRKMRTVYQQTERLGEWQELIRRLRVEHKAKRRLMEVLDGLEGKRIIGGMP